MEIKTINSRAGTVSFRLSFTYSKGTWWWQSFLCNIKYKPVWLTLLPVGRSSCYKVVRNCELPNSCSGTFCVSKWSARTMFLLSGLGLSLCWVLMTKAPYMNIAWQFTGGVLLWWLFGTSVPNTGLTCILILWIFLFKSQADILTEKNQNNLKT